VIILSSYFLAPLFSNDKKFEEWRGEIFLRVRGVKNKLRGEKNLHKKKTS
jgi:hypothetical protein